jgi:signal transduction histidine kinase
MDTGKFVELAISDDGKGFDDKNISDLRGNGLRNISERVNLLNGKCSISSPEGKGTIITISIPKIAVK